MADDDQNQTLVAPPVMPPTPVLSSRIGQQPTGQNVRGGYVLAMPDPNRDALEAQALGQGGGGPLAGLQAAFKSYPVDQAVKAISAANQFLAQRGYQADVKSGMATADAFAKWGSQLIPNGAGVAAALSRPKGPTPQQQITNALAQKEFEQRQKEHSDLESSRKGKATLDLEKIQSDLDTAKKKLDWAKENSERQKDREARLEEGTTTTETERDVPAVPEIKAAPASAGTLGFGAHPAIAARPGVPAHKEKTITKKPGVVNPTQGGQVAAPTVKTIINKKTGERMQVIDGKWQPIQ